MHYEPSAFSGKGVELYNINENKPSPLTKEHICTLINQVALFPKSLNFDYRQLFYDENDGSKCNLTKYMND